MISDSIVILEEFLKGGPGSGIKGHRTYHPEEHKGHSKNLSEEEKARRRERAKKRREARKTEAAKPQTPKPEPKKEERLSPEEEKKARRRERAKKRREAKKQQPEVKPNPFKSLKFKKEKPASRNSPLSISERQHIAKKVVKNYDPGVFLENGGNEALEHFNQHYGRDATIYFKNHTMVFYDKPSSFMTENVLGNCVYFANFEEVNLRHKTWKYPNESKVQTITHELTHSLYSEISRTYCDSMGRPYYTQERAVNEGIAVLGVNLTMWAPHCKEYMQYACATLQALQEVAKEEGTTPKELYKNLSNISPIPLEERKDLKVRLDNLYRSKYSKVKYENKSIMYAMIMWRET